MGSMTDLAKAGTTEIIRTGGKGKRCGVRKTDMDTILFFDPHPDVLPLFQAFEAVLFETFPEVKRRVQKTQITYYNRHVFTATRSESKGVGSPNVITIYPSGSSAFLFTRAKEMHAKTCRL